MDERLINAPKFDSYITQNIIIMKKVFVLTIALFAIFQAGFAQAKVAYVNTQAILEKIPEYTSVQTEIDRISQKWQQELEGMYQEIESLYQDFVKNEVIWPKDLKEEKQQEIFEKERKAKEFREQKFGYSGELFQIQDAKIKPIQDRVFKAVEAVAKKKRFNFVFDKAGEVTWLYTDSRYDLSAEVEEELGLNEEKENGSNR